MQDGRRSPARCRQTCRVLGSSRTHNPHNVTNSLVGDDVALSLGREGIATATQRARITAEAAILLSQYGTVAPAMVLHSQQQPDFVRKPPV